MVTDINNKPYNRSLLVMVLMIGSFATVLNGTILATALPTIMKAFSINTSTVQWLTTGFMLINGIMIPISAWLINRFNTKTIYMGAMFTFLVGTIISYIAFDFPMLLIGRLIQGLGVGITMPLLQTIMLTIFPPNKRGAAMGSVGIVIGLAPAIGPTLSGLIIDNYTWRDLFGIIIPIIVFVLSLSLFFMKNVIPNKNQAVDNISIITSTLGFGSMLYGFSNAGILGWFNHEVLLELGAGILFVSLFVWRQLKMKNPFLDISVFKYKEFSLAALLSGVSNMAMMGVEMLLPIYIQNIRGESAFHSGLILLPGALTIGFVSPIAGRIFDRYGAKMIAITGMTLLSLGTVPFLFIDKNTSILYIIIFYAIRMFGIAMAMMTVTTAGMNVLPFDKISHGTSVNNTFRQVMASIGTAILTSTLTAVTTLEKPAHSMMYSAPLHYRDGMITATISGFHATFMVALGFSLVALLFSLFLNKGKVMHQDFNKEAKK